MTRVSSFLIPITERQRARAGRGLVRLGAPTGLATAEPGGR
jgi:hypothetical protein